MVILKEEHTNGNIKVILKNGQTFEGYISNLYENQNNVESVELVAESSAEPYEFKLADIKSIVVTELEQESMDEEFFELFKGKQVEVTLTKDCDSVVGILECYLPKKDNTYNAILLSIKSKCIEIRVVEIKEIKAI